MPEKHKPHRSPNIYKQPLHLLTILLRLRVTPSVPYPRISSIIFTSFSKVVHRLFRTTALGESQHLFSETGISNWLAVYMEDAYMYAEHWDNRTWEEAVEFEEARVLDVLRCVGLEKCGFEVAGYQEVRARVKWGRERDWSAGSEPLGRLILEGAVGLGWIGKEREEASRDIGPVEMSPRPTLGSISGRFELSDAERFPVVQETDAEFSSIWPVSRHRRDTVPSVKPDKVKFSKEWKIHPCWKSFGEQLEEIRTFEAGMTTDLCMAPKTDSVNRAEAEVDSKWVEFRMPAC